MAKIAKITPETQRKNEISADLLEWIKENHKGRILTKKDIVDYTGLSLTTIDKLMYGVNTVGGRCKYYYLDVAETIAKGGGEPWIKTL